MAKEQSNEQRFEVWKLYDDPTISREDLQQRLRYIGVSRQEGLGLLFDCFLQQAYPSKERDGGIIELPEIIDSPEDRRMPIVGLPHFVLQYIGWAIDTDESLVVSDEDSLRFWHETGFRNMGNKDADTQQLMQWMQRKPYAVANYLDAVWIPEASRPYTDPFRSRVVDGTLPVIHFPHKYI